MRSSESFPRSLPPAPQEPQSSLPADYLRTLRRHRLLIGGCAVTGIVLALLAGVGVQPIYRTRTSLNIQNLNSDFMNMRAVDPTGGGAETTTEENVQTQIKMLQSETLLRNTIDRLESEPHPAELQRTDLISRVRRALHLPQGKAIPYNSVVEETAKQVTVKPLGMTQMVEITCDSWSADFAAKFCNALTNQHEASELETRGARAEKTSVWLTRQVAEMKTKVEESQKRLEDATGGNGLVLSQDSTTVGEDRLRQLQSELVKAQADRMQHEAESKTAAGAAPNTVPSVLDSPGYRAYQTKLADLNAQVAQLVPPLTEENPKVIHLRSQIREVEAGIAEATSSSAGRMQNEYSAAMQREYLLKVAYRIQEGAVSNDLEKMSRVALMRKELESEQTLYQTLLQRVKEAGFASAMQMSAIHVVDEARRPVVPYSPRRGTAAGEGMALGCLVGIGLSFYKDRHAKTLREPGEAERFLRVQELGVIPSTGGPRFGLAAGGSRKPKLLELDGDGDRQPGSAIVKTGWNDRFSLVAEAYRNTTFSLLLSDGGKRTKLYVVSSPGAGEGKTTITSNIGVALSKAKMKVLLIDGDLRRPNLHAAFSLRNGIGLRDLLRGDIDVQTAPMQQYCVATMFPGLSIVCSGSGDEDVVELLHSPRMEEVLTRLSREFDVILIDTPPMLHMADARILAGYTRGALLVVRSGSTGKEQAAAARDQLEHDGVRLVGTILTDFDPSREGLGDYYESYYRYSEDAESTRAESA